MVSELSGSQGDVFWDLAPTILYSPGSELGCVIYVANPTDEAKEYLLMSRLSVDGTVVAEEAVKVFGHAWFSVDPGEFIKLLGALKFDESDVIMSVMLIERTGEEIADSVSTYLVSPEAASIPGWPGVWPGGPSLASTDMSWLAAMMLLAMAGVMVGTLGEPEEDRRETETTPSEEVKQLTAGRNG
ncbi:hypothetical protein ACFL4C_04640 [Candidatus Omnitrophota bacterium]